MLHEHTTCCATAGLSLVETGENCTRDPRFAKPALC